MVKPVGSIGPALFIAVRFPAIPVRARLSILPTFGRTADEKAKAAEQEAYEKIAVEMLDLEDLLRACDKRIVLDDPREHLQPNERHLYLKVARLIAGGVVRNFRDAAEAERDAVDRAFEQDTADQAPLQEAADKAAEPIATRNQHAKHHGCVHAYFNVDHQLPPELAVGIFRRGERHKAILRFSNAHETPQADCEGDGRDMAIKLMPTDGDGEQDFVLVNNPVFPVHNVAEYTRFMEIVHESLRQVDDLPAPDPVLPGSLAPAQGADSPAHEVHPHRRSPRCQLPQQSAFRPRGTGRALRGDAVWRRAGRRCADDRLRSCASAWPSGWAPAKRKRRTRRRLRFQRPIRDRPTAGQDVERRRAPGGGATGRCVWPGSRYRHRHSPTPMRCAAAKTSGSPLGMRGRNIGRWAASIVYASWCTSPRRECGGA